MSASQAPSRVGDLGALLLAPLAAVAGPVLDLAALPVAHAAELLVEDEVLAAGGDLLPRGAAAERRREVTLSMVQMGQYQNSRTS